jgi:hypothetical protein
VIEMSKEQTKSEHRSKISKIGRIVNAQFFPHVRKAPLAPINGNNGGHEIRNMSVLQAF